MKKKLTKYLNLKLVTESSAMFVMGHALIESLPIIGNVGDDQ